MSRFAHLELSSPQLTLDGLRFLTLRSPALKGRGDVTIFVSSGCEDLSNVRACLLLHGVYGSHWAWALCGGAHRTAARLIREGAIGPLVLVMPSDGLWADGTGYLPLPWADYERWIVDDVREAVTEAIPCVGADSPWCIGGLSMGGYGALRLGAKYPERFRAVSGHSSITHLDQMPKFVDDPLDAYGIDGGDDVDVAYWMVRNRDRLPPVRFDCGRDDLLIEENRALHERLVAGGVAHDYAEFAGDHTWEYWATHVEDTLRFFDAAT